MTKASQKSAQGEVIEISGNDGPTAWVGTMRQERVASPGLVTLVVSEVEKTVLNPETLPTGPLPVPRRRARS